MWHFCFKQVECRPVQLQGLKFRMTCKAWCIAGAIWHMASLGWEALKRSRFVRPAKSLHSQIDTWLMLHVESIIPSFCWKAVWFTAVATMTMDSLVTIRHAAGQVWVQTDMHFCITLYCFMCSSVLVFVDLKELVFGLERLFLKT